MANACNATPPQEVTNPTLTATIPTQTATVPAPTMVPTPTALPTTVDEGGNRPEWMDLATGDMIEVEQGVEWITVENIEDCANNPLNDADMAPGGRVDQYLAQIKPELIAATNWDIIIDKYPFDFFSDSIVYKTGGYKGEKFVNPELDPDVPDTNPFDRDIDAFGLYTPDNGNGRRYCFVPLVIRDANAPTESGHDIYILKLLLPLQKNDGTPLSQDQLDHMFWIWNNRMNIAPIGTSQRPMDKLHETDDEAHDFDDPTFAHLVKDSPWFEIWVPTITALLTPDPVHGPLSEFKKLEQFLFSTEVQDRVNPDGTPSNRYK